MQGYAQYASDMCGGDERYRLFLQGCAGTPRRSLRRINGAPTCLEGAPNPDSSAVYHNMTIPTNISPPSHATVLVVGGGPAGSFTSAVLAQEGIDVVCCEAAAFPRYHIGESLLASVKAYLKMVDAHDKIDDHGFHPKVRQAQRRM